MTSQEACLEWTVVYTFLSGSNGWLGMVPRSGKGTRSVARTKGASIPFLSKKIDMLGHACCPACSTERRWRWRWICR